MGVTVSKVTIDLGAEYGEATVDARDDKDYVIVSFTTREAVQRIADIHNLPYKVKIMPNGTKTFEVVVRGDILRA